MNKQIKKILVISLALVLVAPFFMVRASALTSLTDVMSTLKKGTKANHEIKFVTPVGGGVASGETVTIAMPAGFDVSAILFSDIDIGVGNSNNCATASFSDETVSASNSAGSWGANVSLQTLTLTAPSAGTPVVADRCLKIKIGTNAVYGTQGINQITNHATPALYSMAIAGTFGDTGDIAVPILDNDQVSINASVTQALSFSISSTTIGFGTLTTSNVRYATNNNAGATVPTIAHDLQASTNSSGGYTVTVKGPTLTYDGKTITALGNTNTAIASGTEQFGVHYTATGTGSGVISSPYNGAGYAYGDATSTAVVIASAGVATNNNWFNATYIANIEGLTEAGNYSTALTYVATANY